MWRKELRVKDGEIGDRLQYYAGGLGPGHGTRYAVWCLGHGVEKEVNGHEL